MLPIGETLFVYLAGVFSGAAGSYLADKFTDQRRKQEVSRESRSQWFRVVADIPRLIREMREDATKPENATFREFVMLKSPSHQLWGTGEVLAYFENRHQDLPQQMAVLENCGYVTNVSTGSIPRFRMSEAFVELLRDPATARTLDSSERRA